MNEVAFISLPAIPAGILAIIAFQKGKKHDIFVRTIIALILGGAAFILLILSILPLEDALAEIADKLTYMEPICC